MSRVTGRLLLLLSLAMGTIVVPVSVTGRPVVAASPSPLTTIEYAGTFGVTYPTSTATNSPRGVPGDVAYATVTWDAVGQITDAQLYNGEHEFWHYKKLQGTFDYVLLPTPGSSGRTCNQKLSEVAGYEQTVPDQLNISYTSFSKQYSLTTATPFDNRALTTGLKQTDPCAAFAYWVEPGPGEKGAKEFDADYKPFVAVTRGGPYSFHFKNTWKSPDVNATDSLNATLTISAGLTGLTPTKLTPVPGTKVPPSTPQSVREHAGQSFIALAKAGVIPCLGTEAGIVLLPTGPIGTAAGSVLLASAGQLCVTVAEFLYLEYQIINDPPDPAYTQLAVVRPLALAPLALPACAKWTGSAQTTCDRLTIALGMYMTAQARAEAIAGILATTVARESAAAAAHDASALTAQQQLAVRLDTQETMQLGALRAAGAHVASVLRGAKLSWTINGAGTARGLSLLLGSAAARGLPVSRAMALLGGQAPNGPLDAEQVLASTP